MDLLQSLIVPPAYPLTTRDISSRDSQLCHGIAAPSGQISAERPALMPPTGPAALRSAQQEPVSASNKRKKKKKQKQKQSASKQNAVAAAAVLPTRKTITKAKKRKQNQLFHPDRPTSGASRRPRISYEDLYDEFPNQESVLPISDSQHLKSNSEATQTCFFWYHGSCRRSLDRRGCQLRHALLDPPQMIVAPPRFVHPKPCELQWCAGDGPTHKGHGQKARSGNQQKRYFEVAVSDVDSAQEGTDQDSVDESCFLQGFEEPGA